jgi:hypothetical protein
VVVAAKIPSMSMDFIVEPEALERIASLLRGYGIEGSHLPDGGNCLIGLRRKGARFSGALLSMQLL